MNVATLTTKDITGGLVLHVRVSRMFGIRMRIAIWLIGIAARIIDLPVEIELTDHAPQVGR